MQITRSLAIMNGHLPCHSCKFALLAYIYYQTPRTLSPKYTTELFRRHPWLPHYWRTTSSELNVIAISHTSHGKEASNTPFPTKLTPATGSTDPYIPVLNTPISVSPNVWSFPPPARYHVVSPRVHRRLHTNSGWYGGTWTRSIIVPSPPKASPPLSYTPPPI